MIPLVWFLVAWLALIGIFALATLLALTTYLNYGLSSFGTYVSTAIFLGVIALVLLGAGGYLMSIDWSRSLDVLGSASGSLPL